MIEPTVGRVVWIRKRVQTPQPEVALITYVHSATCINVAGFDCNGEPFRQTSVVLRQPEDEAPHYMHAEWMPYQKGQAAKTEALEAAAAKS